ncbi:MAG: TRAP transporter large permease [Oscillospiraceae bacterium]|nr:TRAP transporter large permease [Oscillospiraceae bacterium]
MVGITLLGLFVLLLAFGAPIATCLGLSSVAAILVQGAGKPIDAVMSVLPRLCSSASSKFVLLAIPFFILSGNVMEKAGISGRLINLAEKCLGHIKGGMAIVCVVVSCFFAAISGSGPATVAALGLIMIPALVKAGYPASFSCALMAAGGAIGVVIPPSITFVVYGSIADASITNLFISGMVPGLLMGAGLIAAALILGRKYDLKVQPKASGKERWDAFKDAFFGLMMPVIILGGIYGGIFTPTEAAAVSVFYGLAVGVFIYREIDFKKLIDIMIDSCSTTATVMFITMGATLFAYVLTRARLDLAIKDFMLGVTNGNWIVFFIIVNIVLLIAGCFLDSTSALYIFTPLFAPVAAAMGISPIHLGVVMIVNLAIGLFTPPVGVNLYVACGIGDIKIEEISKGIIPCLVAELIVLLLCTYVPFVSTMFVS